MTTAAARFTNPQAEALCLNAIEAVELYGEGMVPSDIAPNNAEALAMIDGLILYAQLLETTIAVLRGAQTGDPKATRAAARQTAKAWRARMEIPT